MRLGIGVRVWLMGALVLGCLGVSRVAYATIINTYQETFDDRLEGSSIDSVDFWSVTEGDKNNALTESGIAYGGEGQALRLVGAETPEKVVRPAFYGNLTPAWIEFMVKPGLGVD